MQMRRWVHLADFKQLHNTRDGDSHYVQRTDEFTPNYRSRSEQEPLTALIGFREDGMPMVKVLKVEPVETHASPGKQAR